MSEHIKAITDAIISKTTDEELRAIFNTLDAKINPEVGIPNPVYNNLEPLDEVYPISEGIQINPDGPGWSLYIPPTQREHFEYGEDVADFDPQVNDVK